MLAAILTCNRKAVSFFHEQQALIPESVDAAMSVLSCKGYQERFRYAPDADFFTAMWLPNTPDRMILRRAHWIYFCSSHKWGDYITKSSYGARIKVPDEKVFRSRAFGTIGFPGI